MQKITQQELDEMIELHLLWLNNDTSGQRLKLFDKNLSHLDFSAKKLYWANLTDCKIKCANFENSNCANCDFEGSNLAESSFYNTYCVKASFRYCNLSFTDFFRANLSLADFVSANLTASELRNAKLDYANFCFANLQNISGEIIYANFVGNFSAWATLTSLGIYETMETYDFWKRNFARWSKENCLNEIENEMYSTFINLAGKRFRK